MKQKPEDITNLISFFFEIGTLRKTIRSHRQLLLTDDLSDSISSHSYRVAIIGWFLAQMEKVDANKVTLMCLFHDIEESRGGDQNWVHKKYVKVFEEEIGDTQIEKLPRAEDLVAIKHEYLKRETKEAKIAKDADLLDQVLLLREYEWQGNQEATTWLKGRGQEKLMFSRSAKRLAHEVCRQKPSHWWGNLWTPKRR